MTSDVSSDWAPVMGDAAAPWDIEVSSSAARALRRLPEKAATAIVEFITGPLADNPQRLSKPLVGDLEGLRSARRGDYRVLFDLDSDRRLVRIRRIAHRADAYRSV